MADIFISYKSERRAAAEHLAEILADYGFTVWWDYSLVTGRHFGADIERELRAAKAVIVLWCSHSVTSEWVLEEATLAKRLGKTVPVKIENVDLPLGFSLLQTLDLTLWSGAPRDAGLNRLLRDVADKVGRAPERNEEGLARTERAWRRFGAPSLAQFALVADVERNAPPRTLPSALTPNGRTDVSPADATAEPPATAASPSSSDARTSLAVLQFDAFGSANGLQDIADGLVEELLTTLSQFSELNVIARTSSFSFRGSHLDVQSIAKTLKVRYIVEGSVRESGQQLRFSAQLIDATSGAHIWGGRYDRVGTDIIKVQEEVAAEIVQRILPNMWRSEIGRIRRSAPRSLDSWGRSLRAFFDYHERPTPAAAANALRLVETALEEDPTYGFAHVVKACLLAEVGSLPISPAAVEARTGAEHHAAEALRLAEGDPMVLLGCGLVRIHLGQPREALDFLNRACALCPNHSQLRFARGLALIMSGALAEGLAEFEASERLSPIDVVLYRLLVFRSVALFELARDAEAAIEIDRSLSLQPNYPISLAMKAGMLGCAGQLDAAVAFAKRAATEMTVPFAFMTAGIRSTLPDPDLLRRISGGWREVEALIDYGVNC